MSLFADDPICAQHGWMGHVFLHEAAHAVAAIDRNIDFLSVAVLHPSQWESVGDDHTMAGGVDMGRPATDWVPDNPRRAMEFVLAGMCVEIGALGHHLDECWVGDLGIWTSGMNLDDVDDRMSLEATLGWTLAEVRSDTERWVGDRFQEIRAVAISLSGNDPDAAGQFMGVEWRPEMRLDHDDVAAIVAGLDAA